MPSYGYPGIGLGDFREALSSDSAFGGSSDAKAGGVASIRTMPATWSGYVRA